MYLQQHQQQQILYGYAPNIQHQQPAHKVTNQFYARNYVQESIRYLREKAKEHTNQSQQSVGLERSSTIRQKTRAKSLENFIDSNEIPQRISLKNPSRNFFIDENNQESSTYDENYFKNQESGHSTLKMSRKSLLRRRLPYEYEGYVEHFDSYDELNRSTDMLHDYNNFLSHNIRTSNVPKQIPQNYNYNQESSYHHRKHNQNNSQLRSLSKKRLSERKKTQSRANSPEQQPQQHQQAKKVQVIEKRSTQTSPIPQEEPKQCDNLASASKCLISVETQCDETPTMSNVENVELLKSQLETLKLEVVRLQNAHSTLETQIKSRSPSMKHMSNSIAHEFKQKNYQQKQQNNSAFKKFEPIHLQVHEATTTTKSSIMNNLYQQSKTQITNNTQLYHKLLEILSNSNQTTNNNANLGVNVDSLLSNPKIKDQLRQLHTQLLENPDIYIPQLEQIVSANSATNSIDPKIQHDLIDLKTLYTQNSLNNAQTLNTIPQHMQEKTNSLYTTLRRETNLKY